MLFLLRYLRPDLPRLYPAGSPYMPQSVFLITIDRENVLRRFTPEEDASYDPIGYTDNLVDRFLSGPLYVKVYAADAEEYLEQGFCRRCLPIN